MSVSSFYVKARVTNRGSVNNIYDLQFLMLLTNKLIRKIVLLHTTDHEEFMTNFMLIPNERPNGTRNCIQRVQ